MDEFLEQLNEGPIPEIVFVACHFLCGVIFIQYVYKNKNNNPVKQNSPYLTIAAQVLLFISSVCLLMSKILLKNKIKDFNFNKQGCMITQKEQNYSVMIIVSLVYIFSLQFVFMSYFLKMTRVLLIVLTVECPRKYFKKQWILIIISLIWGAFITAIDLLSKYLNNNSERFKLVPQVVSFMCDGYDSSNYNVMTGVKIFWYGRQLIIFILFIWSFFQSYKLQEIDQDLKLRIQYFVLLFLPLLPMIVTKIMKLVNNLINTSLLIHYIDCLINLLAAVILLIIHFKTPKYIDLYLPDNKDLQGQQLSISYLLNNKQSFEVFSAYFTSINKQKLLQIQKLLYGKQFNHKNVDENKVLMILDYIQDENQKKWIQEVSHHYMRFVHAKNYLDKQTNNIIKKWKQTVSGRTLLEKWKKNSQYYDKMRQLNLVKQIIDPKSSISIQDQNQKKNNRCLQTQQSLLG